MCIFSRFIYTRICHTIADHMTLHNYVYMLVAAAAVGTGGEHWRI